MAEYDLDKLGWVELIQTLLKSQIALGIEAWGGTSDEGRDAYFEGKLNYPTRMLSDGPFIFQAKFVRNANAAGAKSLPAIKKAVISETEKIKARGHKFTAPKHYVLLTNAPLPASARRQLKAILTAVLPNCSIHLHDGRDICRWLDAAPDIASRFPQLFTIADLMTLLRKAANQGLLARSQVAVQMATESSKVFVPTEAFFAARRKLRRFSFCILEGPPEMGKTTIGVIVVAIVGNAAEHWVAVLVAMKDKMDLAVNIAIGSSAQIALFVAPVLVLTSFFLGPHPMALVFNGFELGGILLAILIANLVTSEGESTWYEGVQLLAVYLVLAIAFLVA
jgi:Ca2+/Na+ antiporter